MKYRFSFLFVVVFFIIFITYTQIFSQIDSLQQAKINYQANKFKYLLEMLEKYSLDSFDINDVADKAYLKLFQSVNSQSLYFNKQEYTDMEAKNKGKTEGIGIELSQLNDTITVNKVIKGSPADSIGLLVGDKILFVNGQNLVKSTIQNANTHFQKPIGTKVNLIVKRFSPEPLLKEYELEIKEFITPSVLAAFLIPDTKIGYFQINYFTKHTDEELSEKLNILEKQGMQEILIDLRGNQGGIIESVTNCLFNFFEKNTKIVEIKSKLSEFDSVIYSPKDGKFTKNKLIVLIDKNSASSSEIFAGAVQDNDRGIIIGEQSYGKGSIQRIWKMADSSGFRITVAEYLTPSGRHIHKNIDTSQNIVLDPVAQLHLSPKEQDEILDKIKSFGVTGSFPTYFSKNKRVIIGAGGILPDVFVQNDTLTILTRVMMQKAIILEFVDIYLKERKSEIEKIYKDDFRLFSTNYEIDENVLAQLKKYSYSKNIWNENYFLIDKEYLRNYVRALVAYLIWQDNGYKCSMIVNDRVIQKAMESFNNYSKILQTK